MVYDNVTLQVFTASGMFAYDAHTADSFCWIPFLVLNLLPLRVSLLQHISIKIRLRLSDQNKLKIGSATNYAHFNNRDCRGNALINSRFYSRFEITPFGIYKSRYTLCYANWKHKRSQCWQRVIKASQLFACFEARTGQQQIRTKTKKRTKESMLVLHTINAGAYLEPYVRFCIFSKLLWS